MDRRHFLETLAAGLLTVSCTMPVRQSMPGPSPIPVERDKKGLTPLSRFFVTAIVSFPPKIDIETQLLKIDGAIDHPYEVTYTELEQMPQNVQESVLQCVGGASGRARWKGVKIRALLERAGVQAGAKDVVFYGADEYESSIPYATAVKSSSMLALQMNDELLQPKHGAPLRVVLPGIYGYKQVKWLTGIKVVQKNHKGYWEQRGYSDDGTIRSK